MEFQSIFNIFLGVGLTAIGWFARELWDATQNLKKDLQKLELNVSDNYVKKVDIAARFDKIENILERLFDKLEAKADKK